MIRKRENLIICFFAMLILFSSDIVFGEEWNWIRISANKETAYEGEEIKLKIDIYPNELDENIITYPPKLGSLDEVEVKNVAVTSTSSNGQEIQSYIFTLIMKEAGVIKIDPIVINYKDKEKGTDDRALLDGIQFTILKGSILKNDKVKGVIALLIIAALFVAIVYFSNKKLGKRKSSNQVKVDSKQAKDILIRMNKAKIEGNITEFFNDVVKLLDFFGEHDEEYDNYVDLQEKARFGSHQFKNEDIENIYRLMENKFKTRFKDDMKDELSEIEFED